MDISSEWTQTEREALISRLERKLTEWSQRVYYSQHEVSVVDWDASAVQTLIGLLQHAPRSFLEANRHMFAEFLAD